MLKEKINKSISPPVEIEGSDQLVPLANGRLQKYINMDNAASTPAFKKVSEFINNFLPYYSSVHRGSGFKSQLSTILYDQAHEIVANFVGTNLSQNAVIFTKNATEAINKISYRFPFSDDSVVITTEMEHHSNDLPWRDKATTVHVRVTESGILDLEDLDKKLRKYQDRVELVCVSGASNVTGIVQPIHFIAKMAHDFGAKILVDAAQLAPHRKIDMKPNEDPQHIDFLVLSAHKMYAPFGTGALIGPKDIFLSSAPEYSGGGTVASVTLEDIRWAGLPDREEAGSPNVIGALAMAKSMKELSRIDMNRISEHEKELIEYAFKRLKKIDGITLYGDECADRVGVISFNLAGIHHQQVADILSLKYGVGVRNGCFCAHPYVVQLLGLTKEQVSSWREQSETDSKENLPGLVRMSFGCYNTIDEVDYVCEALQTISLHYSSSESASLFHDHLKTSEFIEQKLSFF